MKYSNSRKLRIATAGATWASSIGVLASAVYYMHAARRDEQRDFPLTAAMEWRKAAELFAPETVAADYFWRQWERVMHLPRRLAGAVGEAMVEASPQSMRMLTRSRAGHCGSISLSQV